MYKCHDFLNKEHIRDFIDKQIAKDKINIITNDDVVELVASYMKEYFLKRSVVFYRDMESKTADEYTAIITEPDYINSISYVIGMSENPFHPCGISQFCGELDSYPLNENGEWDTSDKKLELDEVPDLVKQGAYYRMEI